MTAAGTAATPAGTSAGTSATALAEASKPTRSTSERSSASMSRRNALLD